MASKTDLKNFDFQNRTRPWDRRTFPVLEFERKPLRGEHEASKKPANLPPVSNQAGSEYWGPERAIAKRTRTVGREADQPWFWDLGGKQGQGRFLPPNSIPRRACHSREPKTT